MTSNNGPVMHTLFELCNDVVATRQFYSEGVGLRETFFDGDRGWLSYQAGAVQLVFTVPDARAPELTEWSRSPGWDGGTVDASSWVFRVAPEEFDAVVARLRSIGAPIELREFDERGLREVFARDPVGKTVEVYAEDEAAASGEGG